MEKPIVFLSHSSKNKRELIALKELLDQKAVGAIEFFLSSDGESIPLGTSWHDRIVNALKVAKLMFVFVSPESVTSGWVYFEAGFAVSKGIRVIPVCLPGIDFNRLPPPLNLLLQARELHSVQGLNRLLAECNKEFLTRIPESFTKDDFNLVFGRGKDGPVKPSLGWDSFVEKIEVEATTRGPAIQAMLEVCRRHKTNGVEGKGSHYGRPGPAVLGPGMEMIVPKPSPFLPKIEEPRSETQSTDVFFTLSPKLFHVTASLIDDWGIEAKAEPDMVLNLLLTSQVELEEEAHRLTTKIHDSRIRMITPGVFEYFGFRFRLAKADHYNRRIDFRLSPNESLAELPLRELVEELFELGVLVKTQQKRKRINYKGGF